MTEPIRTTESTIKRINVVEPTVARIDPALVAAALGAEPTGDRIGGGSPVARHASRVEIYRRRIAKTQRLVEIQISDQDWTKLEKLAAALGSPGNSPSAGQVASVLLSLAIETVDQQTEPSGKSTDGPMAERLAEKMSSKT